MVITEGVTLERVGATGVVTSIESTIDETVLACLHYEAIIRKDELGSGAAAAEYSYQRACSALERNLPKCTIERDKFIASCIREGKDETAATKDWDAFTRIWTA